MSAGAKCLRPEKCLQHRRYALAAKASKAPKAYLKKGVVNLLAGEGFHLIWKNAFSAFGLAPG